MRQRNSIRGFTMLEATLAIALTAVAGSAILLGINTSLESTSTVLDKTIAVGMVEQLIDEAVGAVYGSPGAGPYQTDLGPNSYEMAGSGRERFNDIDDYTGVSTQPPKDLYGVPLGTEDGLGGTRPAGLRAPTGYFNRWRQRLDVYYVNPNNFSQRLTGNNTSDYRCVDARVEYNDPVRGWLVLAQERRIVTYLQRP